MFLAMNRFKVAPGSEREFEQMWLQRESHLPTVPGFVEFHFLRGPARDDHVLYSSHTVWTDRESFEAWTNSEQFRAAHRPAGSSKPLTLGPPQFEGFESLQRVGHDAVAAA